LFENTLDIQAKTLSDLKDMQANTERLRAVILNYDDRIHEVQDENLKLQAELSILISRQQEPSLEYRFKELKESSLRRLQYLAGALKVSPIDHLSDEDIFDRIFESITRLSEKEQALMRSLQEYER
jgi:predicted  nucleic acid-binding Zn-ribbon protein